MTQFQLCVFGADIKTDTVFTELISCKHRAKETERKDGGSTALLTSLLFKTLSSFFELGYANIAQVQLKNRIINNRK